MRRGFTLLEVLVASLIMAIAVTGLLSSLSTSVRNAARLVQADRAAALAKQKMDELLLDTRLPRGATVEGGWDDALTGGEPAGWRARVSVFETAPEPGPGDPALERIELEVWCGARGQERRFTLDGYRRGVVTEQDAPKGGRQ